MIVLVRAMQNEFKPIVAAEVWREYPEYRALSITARHFCPAVSPLETGPLTPPAWMEDHLESWRAAFRRFGANPQKTPSSIEALWKRVSKTGSLPAVAPLVDFYNALSVQFGAPFGGEDLDCYEGVPQLVPALGTESFDTMRAGTAVVDYAEPGEIIWKDNQGVTCRRWNWRQCKRTALMPHSTNLWFIIDRLPPMPLDDLAQAGERLVLGLHRLCPLVETTICLLEPST